MSDRRLTAALLDALTDNEALDVLVDRLWPRLADRLATTSAQAQPPAISASQPLTPAEVAAATRQHPQTVYRHLRDGRLQGERPSTRWLISPEALEAYLAADGAG